MENNLIYIVEDDQNISDLEAYALKNSSFNVNCFKSASEFYPALEEKVPTLILLDVMLPGEDGLHILEKIRANSKTKDIPVIMVTAKTEEIDAVKGLDLGADDYIHKPFGVMELISRVKAVIRRTVKEVEPTRLVFKEISLDEEKHTVEVNNSIIDLTFKEYQILELLLRNKGIVLTRDTLMERIWGYDFEQGNRTVDVHIQSLRKKLGQQGKYIKTIRNVGYKIGE